MSGMVPAILIAAVLVVLGYALHSGVLKGGSSGGSMEPTADFRIADYRQDGSRFASSGNVYVFDGRVESIETIGNDRLICISIPHNPDERLPLLVPGGATKVNITRGDRFLFVASCRTGLSDEGEQVKGVLVVTRVETR